MTNNTWVLDSSNIRNFPHIEGNIIYHHIKGGLCLLDPQAFAFLSSFKGGVNDKDIHNSQQIKLFNEFKERNFIKNKPQVQEKNANFSIVEKIKIVQLIVTNGCNFNCSYCFENRRKTADIESVKNNDIIYPNNYKKALHTKNNIMSPKDAIEYINILVNHIVKKGQNNLIIQFFGGEPMVNWKAINAVLKHFGNGEKWQINIQYSIVTNGALITEEVANIFSYYKVAVCVSFDSPESTDRILKNGKDAKPQILEGVKNLQKYNNRIAFNATLSSSNWHYINSNMVKFAHDIGIKEIGIVLELDPDFYYQYTAQKIVQHLKEIIDAGNTFGVTITGYWHQISQLMTTINGLQDRGYKMCSAKGVQISIEPNGFVYSCKGASGFFGHIKEGFEALAKKEAYQQHLALSKKNPIECSGCAIEHFCSGICLGSLEKKYNTIETIEPAACGVYKGITSYIISQYTAHDIPYFSLGEH